MTDDTGTALRFITCGSVDDGKSTLIGRLLLDSRAVLQDQLASVSRSGSVDLAQFTDGLMAEREQGITIDVAWRYFSTARRKFIIGDTPGHEQYTRNMVTAASNADAAVVLVDATKLPWHGANGPSAKHQLLAQTRRHSLLLQLLRVPSIVFAINKLDAVDNAERAFANIQAAILHFAQAAGISVQGVAPISALLGHNVVDHTDGWCGCQGPGLLNLLEQLPIAQGETDTAFSFPVQWIEVPPGAVDASRGRRVFWGRVTTGAVGVGTMVSVFPGGQTARVVEVLDHVRRGGPVAAGHSAGIVLDREVDVSRGDWLLTQPQDAHALAPTRNLDTLIAWLDDEPLVTGRVYWALHGHRWVKARVERITHQLNVLTLAEETCDTLPANAIGRVHLSLQEPVPIKPYALSRTLGALVLVDTASHKTAGAVLVIG